MKNNILINQLQLLPWTKEEIDFFLSKLREKHLEAMELLHHEGSVCQFEAFVEKGILRSFYQKDEEERINQFFFEGQWVSDYQSFIEQKPSKVSIQALEDCKLWIISKSDVDILSKELPDWDSLGMKFFKKLFLKKEKRNASLLLASAKERYLAIVKETPELIDRIPQYYIAQYIGIAPESLSRIRKELAHKNH